MVHNFFEKQMTLGAREGLPFTSTFVKQGPRKKNINLKTDVYLSPWRNGYRVRLLIVRLRVRPSLGTRL